VRPPDFNQLLKVLRREEPDRPVMFELPPNGELVQHFAEPGVEENWSGLGSEYLALAHRNMGYDYTMGTAGGFAFPKGERERQESVSLNQGALITDRSSFEAYDWPDPDDCDYSALADPSLPEAMKLIVWGPGGVLENVIGLVGFERLCYLSLDDEQLVSEIFDAVGSRLVRYYEICAGYDSVGALMGNDDWGFKTQTMLRPDQMRRWVIPWHARIVEKIHAAGKPAILHSCGNLEAVMDDIIDVIGYDAKHSYEDQITPVEEAYERWGGRIAVLGGIDVDFLCRNEPDRIVERCRAMLERAGGRGGYALGSGNSIPGYVPVESFLAMRSAALECA
jgi:uroporphyrinogen decarboxylase